MADAVVGDIAKSSVHLDYASNTMRNISQLDRPTKLRCIFNNYISIRRTSWLYHLDKISFFPVMILGRALHSGLNDKAECGVGCLSTCCQEWIKIVQ